MKFGRWLLMAVLASFAAVLMISSVSGQRLGGANSAVIFDYEVANDGGIHFADEFDRLGGVDTLGHPASYRYEQGGFTYQVTQRALLQWRPEVSAAYLGNIFQMLEDAGFDQWLVETKGIPLPIKDDGSGGDWDKARETRLSWLTNEQIKAKYLANPNPDAISDWNEARAIELYGLPMSMPERHGPFISQRFQRVAFQLWVDDIAGSPAPGTVIGVLAGDILKEAGLVPAEGLNVAERPVVVVAPAPAPAPAPSSSQPRATAKPQATAVATAVATPDTTPPAANLTLSSLSLGDLALSPAFDADTITYTANAANEVESVTVTAEAASEDATVAITAPEDADAAADGHQAALAEGADTTITIVVTSGEDTATYTVTVTRAAAPLAEGAVLTSLSLSDVTLSPGFSSETLNYTASVVNDIESTTVKVTVPEGARLGPAAAAEENGHSVTLVDGPNPINIAVTVGDVTTFYKIVITRGEAAADASLETLAFSGVTLVPEFARHTYIYKATVANSVVNTDVTQTANDTSPSPNIVYRVGAGQGLMLPAMDIPLTEDGTTTIKVEVTSGDGDNTQTYTVVITRLGGGGETDTSLATLSLSDIELTFRSDVRSYFATVEYGDAVTLMTEVSWSANAAGAQVQLIVNGRTVVAAAPIGVDQVAPLLLGENLIKLVVTARDTNTQAAYDIRVTREAYVLSSDTTLSDAGIVAPTLSIKETFDKDLRAYTATVANSVGTVGVTATPNHDGAMVEVSKGEEIDTTSYTLTVGGNEIVIKVTAEDETVGLYTLTITKQGTVGDADASLFRLTINDSTDANVLKPITLTPSFSGQRADYTAEVSFDTERVSTGTDHFTPNRSGTMIEILIDDDDDGQIDDTADNVPLAVGPNEFIVRATTGNIPPASMDYNFTVTRLERVDSSDATLSVLSLTNVTEFTPLFDPKTRPYVAAAGKTVVSTTVTATATDTSRQGAIEITPEDANDTTDDGHQVELDEGPNLITIKVTAEDGTTKSYTVTVTKTALSQDSALSALGLKDDEDDVTLDQPFSAGTTRYAAATEAATLTLTATENDTLADVQVNVNLSPTEVPGNEDDEYTITLQPGSNTIVVKVTAENDDHETTYRITVTRS